MSVAPDPIDEVGFGATFDAPIEKNKDSLKRYADIHIHSGWQD